MTIRTQLKAGGRKFNHNETLRVRTALKAGIRYPNHNETLKVRTTLKAGVRYPNHNEALQVRTALKAGAIRLSANHNETLRREDKRPEASMRKQIRTTSSKEDRLELLVVRAGLRAGRAVREGSRRHF